MTEELFQNQERTIIIEATDQLAKCTGNTVTVFV